MLTNLTKEMLNRGISVADLSEVLGKSEQETKVKLQDPKEMLVTDMYKIQRLFPDKDYDYLFQCKENELIKGTPFDFKNLDTLETLDRVTVTTEILRVVNSIYYDNDYYTKENAAEDLLRFLDDYGYLHEIATYKGSEQAGE